MIPLSSLGMSTLNYCWEASVHHYRALYFPVRPDHMAAKVPPFISGSLRHLRHRANIHLYEVPRTPFISPKYSQRPHAYSTSPPTSSPRNKPNYKVAILCGLTAVAATWAITTREPKRLDAPSSIGRPPLTRSVEVEITRKDKGNDVEEVATGTSTIPYFPRTIWLPKSGGRDEGRSAALPAGMGAAQDEDEYQLLGLGIRKVSLFRIQVYVVGLYVAKADLGKLQEELIKASVGSGASTLVQGEKEQLQKTLLDGQGSNKVWEEVLKEGGVRSAVRIVPTRNTNFSHLRDGWLRGIDLRAKGKEFEGDDFKAAVGEFKSMLGGRGSVAKGKVLLLGRGANGALRAWVEEEAPSSAEADPAVASIKGGKMTLLGGLKDERISRLVWMGYLAGDHIASEEARESVVRGVMEIVERPIGTVETQVI